MQAVISLVITNKSKIGEASACVVITKIMKR